MNNDISKNLEKEKYKTTLNDKEKNNKKQLKFNPIYGEEKHISDEEKKKRKRKRNNIIKMIVFYLLIAIPFVFLINMFMKLDVRVVTTENAFIREEPTTDSKIVKELKLYDEIAIIKDKQDWFLVETQEDKTKGYILKSNVSEQSVSSQIDNNIVKNPLKTILSIAFMIMLYPIAIFLIGVSWKFSLEELSGKKLNFINVLSVHGKANIAKYVPGGIFHFVGRNYLGKDLGLTQTELGLGSAIEAMLFPFVCFVLFLFFVISGIIKIPFEKIYSRINVNSILLAVVVIIVILGLIIGVIYILFKKNIIKKDIFHQLKEIKKRVSTKRIIILFLKLFITYTLFHLMESLMLAFTFLFIFNLDLSVYEVFLVMGSYITGYFFGMFITAAPNSILVRESIIALVLSSSGYFGNIIVAGLITRGVTISGDILAFLVSNLVSFIKNRRLKKQNKKMIKNTHDEEIVQA